MALTGFGGCSREDEVRLLEALYTGQDQCRTTRQALNSLDGVSIQIHHYAIVFRVLMTYTQVNNKSAYVWKDYYLDHKDRLDAALFQMSVAGHEDWSASSSEHEATPPQMERQLPRGLHTITGKIFGLLRKHRK